MSEAEQDRQVGKAYRRQKQAQHRLACLDSKLGDAAQEMEITARAIRDRVITAHPNGALFQERDSNGIRLLALCLLPPEQIHGLVTERQEAAAELERAEREWDSPK